MFDRPFRPAVSVVALITPCFQTRPVVVVTISNGFSSVGGPGWFDSSGVVIWLGAGCFVRALVTWPGGSCTIQDVLSVQCLCGVLMFVLYCACDVV